MCHWKRSVLLILILGYSSLLQGEDLGPPKGVKVVAAPEVRDILKTKKAVVVHTLSRIEYALQHIPGSINIPIDEIGTSEKMPESKNTPIVFYCNGKACPYSRRASETAVELGYTKINWFQGGIKSWRTYRYEMVEDKALKEIKVGKYSPEKFQQLAQSNDVVILDVRPQWWRETKVRFGVIEGTSLMIPLLKLDRNLELLSKEQKVLIVDRHMRQSIHAAKYLIKNGFNVIGVLKGGSKRWVNEGLPVLNEGEEPSIASFH